MTTPVDPSLDEENLMLAVALLGHLEQRGVLRREKFDAIIDILAEESVRSWLGKVTAAP